MNTLELIVFTGQKCQALTQYNLWRTFSKVFFTPKWPPTGELCSLTRISTTKCFDTINWSRWFRPPPGISFHNLNRIPSLSTSCLHWCQSVCVVELSPLGKLLGRVPLSHERAGLISGSALCKLRISSLDHLGHHVLLSSVMAATSCS